jgi:broad specificity phosphatase PhoE
MNVIAPLPIQDSPSQTIPLMPLCVYLTRHGETEWSLSGQYTGRTDIPLTPRGEEAAREAGRRIRDLAFTHVLSSPLQRARRTCQLAGLSTTTEVEPDLTEWDHGDYEGRYPADILRTRPDWNLFRDGAPHGETPAQVSARADRVIAWLRALTGNVALFSHGHFGRVLGARWVGLSVRHAQHLLLDPASLSVLVYEHDCTDAPAIALWNFSAHRWMSPATESRDEAASNR